MIKKYIYDFMGANEILFETLNQITNVGFVPYIFYFISSLFYFMNFIIYFSAIFLYFCKKSCQFVESSQRLEYLSIRCSQLFNIGLTYLFFVISYPLLKYNVNLPRPFCSAVEFQTIMSFAHKRCLSSFPSAHSALAFMMLYYSWPYLRVSHKFIGVVFLVMVSLSRLTLAMHFPADIIYGILIIYILIQISGFISKLIGSYVGKEIAKYTLVLMRTLKLT